MTRRLVITLSLTLIALFLNPTVQADGPRAASDKKAVRIAERVMDAMGGQDAWQGTRYVRFNFFGFRLHHWDRQTGDHRLEGESRSGDDYVILHNISNREGRAWVNGEEVSGEDLAQRLEYAYGAWINDTYWLVMPYKLQDPGVTLAYDGVEEIDGATYDKLLLTFDNVGLTPGDRYWAYISRETHLMDRWAYHLESYEEGQEPTQWKWLDWQRHGDIMLSSQRVKVEDGNERALSDIAILESLSSSAFTSPEPIAGE